MEERLNVFVRQAVRKDLVQNGRVAYLPAGMTAQEIDEAVGDALKKGLIKKVVPVPEPRGGGGAGGDGGSGGAGGAGGSAGSEQVWSKGPASVEIIGNSNAFNNMANVTAGLAGPCMIEYVRIWTLDLAHALNKPRDVGLHVCRDRNALPFSGDMAVFRMEDPGDIITELSGEEVQIFDQREDTAVGYIPRTMYEFFPHLLVPWPVFYLNYTVGKTNGASNTRCDVSFGPVSVPKIALGGATVPIPRPTAEPVSVAPAPDVPHIETRTFFGYAAIKTAEALGFKPIWSTIHAVPGQAGFYSIQGVVK